VGREVVVVEVEVEEEDGIESVGVFG